MNQWTSSGNTVSENVVFDNTNGIYATVPTGNRVYDNSQVGIECRYGTVQGNGVYSNSIGIKVIYSGTLSNNLVYANTNQGIWVNGIDSSGCTLVNNTVYQAVGDAVRWTAQPERPPAEQHPLGR